MNTQQINKQLRSVKCFEGTYAIDKLPRKKFKFRPLAVIINLDKSYSPGSHWVALYIDVNNIGWFLDSFGRSILNKYIRNFLKNQNVFFIFHNSKSLQGRLSEVCGVYCILFIKMMCSSFHPDQFLKIFSKSKVANDRFVIKILQ